uniref:Wzz/FepE/Etk N-terminal domain-containing protein n=1 Tax=Algoriphagus sp. TaxID=1872435 RepID=UPI004047AC88
MTDNTPSPSPSNSEDEIDLKDLIIPIWRSRKQILTTAIIFAIIGGIIGFLTPATYTASSTFLPQTSQAGGGLSGSLGGLASLAGINLSTGSAGGGEIPPSMYATVLASEPFRKRILDARIWVNGDSVTYRTYLENQPKSGISTIKEYTIGLPGKLINLLTAKEEEKQPKNEVQGLQPLSNKEYGLLGTVSGNVSIVHDKKEGIITISVVETDPIIAAQVTKVTENVLQDWISEHKMKNAKAQYDFIEKQFEAKQKEFFSIQEQLANYMDRNQNVLSATYLTHLERLQAEFDLVNTVYSELAKQKEQAAIQLSKVTPTFSVLDPVKVPKEKTGPKKSLYVIAAFFTGLIFSAVWFLAKKPIQEYIKGMQIES